ncbi:MFS transporter [Mitsuokella multacida]|uniref:MFS transporter n=1 Tax=Mitsuokella multacida TaxID=52226 RepID=UPI00242F9692|nr:MFS transporter [Mitsuokella multacida]
MSEKKQPGVPEQHATRAIFFVGGFGAASWAPLVPLLKARLGIAEDVLGMLLLCIGIGSLLTMPMSGAAAVRLGCRKVLTAAGLVYAVLLLSLCTVSSFGMAVPLLLIFGATMGCIDVVGGVFLTTVRHFDMSLAGTAFTVFSAAMLTMRLFGDWTVQKLGQERVVIGGSLLAVAGFLLVIFAAEPALLYLGFFAIGIGCANVVPVFFSLLGKQRVMPVSLAVPAVSTLGYLGILMGPAVIGFIAHQTSLYTAFGLLAFLVLLQSIIAAYVYRHILD